MKRPSTDELVALKAREEAKREAYLSRRFTPAQRWRWQQQAIESLARLRPELRRRFRLDNAPEPPPKPATD